MSEAAARAVPTGGDWDQPPMMDTQVDVSGGIHSSVEPFYISPNELYYLKNANLDTLGVRTKRNGVYSIGGAGLVPRGMGSLVNDDMTRRLAVAWDQYLYLSNGSGTWAHVTGSSYSLAGTHMQNIVQGRALVLDASGVTTSATALFVNGIGYYTGSTFAPLWTFNSIAGPTLNISLCPGCACWWQGRLWLGNLSNPGFTPDTLLWSNIYNGLAFGLTNNIEIDARRGDQLVAIVPTRSSEARLYLFKRHAIYALDVVWGSGQQIPTTENTLDTANARLVTLSAKIGCVAPKTIVYGSGSAKSDIFFLARDGLRSLERVEQDVAGGASTALTDPIKDVINRINWAVVKTSNASVWDNKLRLSIPVDGATSPNLTIVFDLERKIWIGEENFSTVDMLDWDFASAGSRLYTQWGAATTDAVNGTNPTLASHIFEMFRPGQFYDPTPSGVTLYPVAFEEKTRGFIFENYGAMKRWNWLELILNPATTNATLSVYAKVDEYDWQLLADRPVTPKVDNPILPWPLVWLFGQPKPQTEKFDLTELPPGHQIQIKTATSSPSTMGLRTLRLTAWPYQETWE